ncbi:glucosaminyl-phosphatidylinositol-acyltransferase PIGW-like [Arctopsyche grandis]|uniref:glucosaminyl-phosphatidylinositol- acyltransferase PIGW-like n=1 Tax=Arctopsyche grandis TaxID=121162 RepID=UPI00406D8B3C
MSAAEYKQIHEAFMQNNNGTTAFDTFATIIPTFFTPCILRFIIIHFSIANYFHKICLEFAIIILPIILATTVASEHRSSLLVLSLLIFICLYWKKICNVSHLWELKVQNKKEWHCITYLRALVSLLTVHCILAVDFNIFPRHFAKTERYGYSLMDTGVGLFIFTNAIVPSKVSKYGLFKSLERNAKPCIVLFILGYARVMIIKEVDYHEHITEYGLHWNFFITLAITKIIGTSLLYIFKEKTAWISGITLMILHEISLYNGLSEWVYSNISRDTFLTANREGIVSCLGYISLYLASSYIGHIIHEKYEFKSEKEILNKLLISAAVSWTVAFISNGVFGTSRCLANAGYCSFIFAIGSSMLTLFYMFELSDTPTKSSDKHKDTSRTYQVPIILSAINRNGLLFFLLGNVVTGLINLLFHTLYLDVYASLFIIFLYMFIVIMTIITIQYSKTVNK